MGCMWRGVTGEQPWRCAPSSPPPSFPTPYTPPNGTHSSPTPKSGRPDELLAGKSNWRRRGKCSILVRMFPTARWEESAKKRPREVGRVASDWPTARGRGPSPDSRIARPHSSPRCAASDRLWPLYQSTPVDTGWSHRPTLFELTGAKLGSI